jgi:hypothetical protein
VDRVGARLLRRTDVLLRGEVGSDLDRLVGASRMEGARVVRRRDGNRRDPELAACPEDPQRDLAAVRNEQLADR